MLAPLSESLDSAGRVECERAEPVESECAERVELIDGRKIGWRDEEAKAARRPRTEAREGRRGTKGMCKALVQTQWNIY
jgi:hypothetical protein